ncbi:MAG: four helix bundle protein [Bacteroidales bacterium]|jgi:four helix bundle protein|nr:four helix bundle protein [Bacteroidales bacterium]
MAERKNRNRGFKQLRVWQDSVTLFVLVNRILKYVSYNYNKPKSNTLDAAHSILRNIAEGYCRKSPREYLNFLNYALGSSGELLSGMIGFQKAEIVSEIDFENFDTLHYKTENELLKLAESIQKKIKEDDWDQNYGKSE